VATADYDNDDDNKKADDSDMECIVTTACSSKHQAWPLTDHFERLLEEVCPNHAYPIKHKLKNCGMIKNFITLGSLIWDKEPEEVPGKSDAMPFPREDAVMTVYDGCPPLGRHRMSGILTRCGWGPRNARV
jgi:hypothetical protein